MNSILSKTTLNSTNNAELFYCLFIALSIFSYIIPIHSPFAHDFLPNAFSCMLICIGIITYLTKNSLYKLSISTFTWLMLSVLILIQPLINKIYYPDALIFPVMSLWVISIASIIATQIKNKNNFIIIIAIATFFMLSVTLIIQIMQVYSININWDIWPLTRLAAIDNRMDGNFGQANEAAYAYILGLCIILYYLKADITKNYKLGFCLLLILCIFGLVLTKSRAGFLMALSAIAVFYMCQPMNMRLKSIQILKYGLSFIVIYIILSLFVKNFLLIQDESNFSAISRMGVEVTNNRVALNQRAIDMFVDNPLTGVGWNKYSGTSVEYAQNYLWPEVADHSHFFLTQIAAELGVLGLLCLLPIGYLTLKFLHCNHTRQSALMLSFVVASLFYASLEYPFWYFRYLLIFAVFLSLIDQKYVKFSPLSKIFRNLILLGMLISIIGCVFYSINYWKSNYLFYKFTEKYEEDSSGSTRLVINKPIFGFTNYHERILAGVIPINEQNINNKVEFFERVVSLDTSQYNLTAYGILLGYDGNKKGALKYFKAGCVMARNDFQCINLDKKLQEISLSEPLKFKDIYKEFSQWRLRQFNIRN